MLCVCYCLSVIASNDFETLQAVPCKNKVQVDTYVPGSWMVAYSPTDHPFDFSLIRRGIKTIICGPYWRSLVRVYDIQLGDVVHFELDKEEEEMDEDLNEEVQADDEKEFNNIKVTVYSIVNNMKKAKRMLANPGMITTLIPFILLLVTWLPLRCIEVI